MAYFKVERCKLNDWESPLYVQANMSINEFMAYIDKNGEPDQIEYIVEEIDLIPLEYINFKDQSTWES